MGRVKIPYYRVKNGIGYWEPSALMRAHGMKPAPCGKDGPAAWALAASFNRKWQAVQAEPAPAPRYPAGSIGDGFLRYRQTIEWQNKAPRTRQDWEWAWRRIGEVFGDVPPDAVTMEDLSAFKDAVRKRIGAHEAHRCLKIWRALWTVLLALRYTTLTDPSKGIRNAAPSGRDGVWSEGEIVRLAKQAWRAGYHGLALAIAIAWDTQFSPADVRTLRLCERQGDAFHRERAKTGRAAIGTLSRRTLALLDAYLESRTFLPSAPFLRNRSGAPYSSDTIGDDFRTIRAGLFPGDKRAMIDIRRSGAVEAMRGNATPADLSNKMANSLSTSNRLHRTYLPVDLESVKKVDSARLRGRKT